MKKQVLSIFTVLTFVITMAVNAAHAQSEGPIRVSIPFDFSVGSKALPAGDYTVSRNGTAGSTVLMIRGAEAGALFITMPAKDGEASAGSRLVFNRYGDQYFLSQVWEGRDAAGHQLQRSRKERLLEREMAYKGFKANTATVIARQ